MCKCVEDPPAECMKCWRVSWKPSQIIINSIFLVLILASILHRADPSGFLQLKVANMFGSAGLVWKTFGHQTVWEPANLPAKPFGKEIKNPSLNPGHISNDMGTFAK